MPEGRQGKIFISYRRQETAWPARQLYEVLVARFGAGSVFKDVDDIDPGDDFVERITDAVAACDVLLALIGNRWATMTDARGRRRLDDPDDFVRLELTAALTRGVRVVPILVDGAAMPQADELPPDLLPLTRRQAVEISPVGFNTDRLLATLAATMGTGAAARLPEAAPAVPPPDAPAVRPPAVVPVVAPVPAAPSAPPPDAAPSASDPPGGDARSPAREEAPPGPATPPSATPPSTTPPSTAPSATTRPALPVFGPPPDPAPAPPDPQPGGAVPVRPLGGSSPQAGSPAAPGRPRVLVLVGAAVAVLVLVASAVVLWPRGTPVAAATPSPAASAPATATVPATNTPSPASGGDVAVPMILAHRGGLEKHQFETQQAMEAAAADGFSVETDVRFTSDGVAVLVHDEQATKGLDCGGTAVRVSRTTWKDLNRLCKSKPTSTDPAQYPVPRLDPTLEGIAAASGNAMVFLEVKTAQTTAQREEFLAAPVRYGLRERTVITSFSREWLDDVARAAPEYKRMLFVSGRQVPAASLADEGLWAVGVEQGVATPSYLRQLQAIGVKVMVWVLNDPAQWATFTAQHPDIIMTAYPSRLEEWLAQR